MFNDTISPKTFSGLLKKFSGLYSGGLCQYISYPNESIYFVSAWIKNYARISSISAYSLKEGYTIPGPILIPKSLRQSSTLTTVWRQDSEPRRQQFSKFWESENTRKSFILRFKYRLRFEVWHKKRGTQMSSPFFTEIRWLVDLMIRVLSQSPIMPWIFVD